jgi:signal transduction histidine kinase
MISPSDAQGTVAQTAVIAGRLAHDFSNYLTSILGFAELAVQDLPPDSPAREYVFEVWQAARDVGGWVQRLNFLGRPKPERIEPTDIVALARQEEGRLRDVWKKTIEFKTSFDTPLLLIAVEKESLRRVLTELLDNARESISGQGNVTLAVRRAGAWAEVDITDTGAGFPPAFWQKPFPEPFFSAKPGHRGLGLLIVQWILQQYGGEFHLGALPTPGTQARVLLPVASCLA